MPLNGKKRKLTRADWVDYLAYERLGLTETMVNRILADLRTAGQKWQDTIASSFLSTEHQVIYQDIVSARLGLFFG